MGYKQNTKGSTQNAIRLLVTLDQGYVPQLCVLLTSIRMNNPGEAFELYLLHNQLPDHCCNQIERYCSEFGIAFFPICVDDALFRDAPASSRYPKEMYYRLLAPQLLPEHIQRILYLDPDILVINPLRPLWELDLCGRLFAAAAHTGKTELANSVNRIRLKTDHDYYNSGVLLMDLEAGRKEISPDELFQYVAEHENELLFPDQDVLNALYGNHILAIDDVIWNYDARNYNNYLLRSSGVQNLNWVMENTAILHFCGKAKPWKEGYLYRFGGLYRHYMQLTRRIDPREPNFLQNHRMAPECGGEGGLQAQ